MLRQGGRAGVWGGAVVDAMRIGPMNPGRSLSIDLSVSWPGFTLFAKTEIPLTGITALSGPSGSGKTTLLRSIAGLERHARGTVSFAGKDWTRLPPQRRGTGYVFQDARLFPHMTVAGNLNYGAKRRDASADAVAAVVEALDLRELLCRRPGTLSGGETRRVALGRALASAPRILLLDEPLAGLDWTRKAELLPYIARAVAAFGVPAIYVTHSASELSYIADRTLGISGGCLGGWTPAGPRLIGKVKEIRPGQIKLALGDRQLWLAGEGYVGETWAIPLGQDYLLSCESPGISNAALILDARVMRMDPDAGSCDMAVAGQKVTLPWIGDDCARPQAGAMLWLSLPKLFARPVMDDLGN